MSRLAWRLDCFVLAAYRLSADDTSPSLTSNMGEMVSKNDDYVQKTRYFPHTRCPIEDTHTRRLPSCNVYKGSTHFLQCKFELHLLPTKKTFSQMRVPYPGVYDTMILCTGVTLAKKQ